MKNFWFLFSAYAIVWTVLWVYVVYLSRANKALKEDIAALRAQVENAVSQANISRNRGD